MSVTKTGAQLLTSLRRTKSKSALYEVPAQFFDEGQEREAYLWLKDYVTTYNAWPTPQTMQEATGVKPLLVPEPLMFYANQARQRALWQLMLEPFKDFRRAMETKQPDEAMEIMRRCQMAASELNHQNDGLISFREAMTLVREDYYEAKRTVGLRGIPTGIEFLDEVTDGWQNSDLISVVARPGRGKTYKLLKFASAAHQSGHSVMFLSMEMGVLQLARRYFGVRTRVNPTFLRRGELSTRAEREMEAQITMMGEEEVPFWFLAGNFKKTVPALKAAVYRTQPDLIIADASYLLTPEKSGKVSSRREAIADVIEQLGGLTKEVNRPLIQSVQFNRQATKPKRGEDEEASNNPVAHLSLEKIGETDVVGQASAIVLGLEKGDPPHESDERYCGLLKGREGEEGWFRYHYKFQPVNFDYIDDHRTHRRANDNEPEAPDLSYMEAEA